MQSEGKLQVIIALHRRQSFMSWPQTGSKREEEWRPQKTLSKCAKCGDTANRACYLAVQSGSAIHQFCDPEKCYLNISVPQS